MSKELIQEFSAITDYIKSIYGDGPVPLHAPVLGQIEKKYLAESIDSGFVSSVGPHVEVFEKEIARITGASYVVAVVNGTAALHAALNAVGVRKDDLVLTQALSFVATANAISYTGAQPVFLDSEESTLGLCPKSLERFLNAKAVKTSEGAIFKSNGKRISACVPMHVFGYPLRIKEIVQICQDWNIKVVEDAAEALGSYFDNKHLGLFGDLGVVSFNGNKIITTGGGGAILIKDEAQAKKIRHTVTTAKSPHPWKYYHDEIGFNYRMPNLNAALGCAQLQQLDGFVEKKSQIFTNYKKFFEQSKYLRFHSPEVNAHFKSNHWLNAFFLPNIEIRNQFLEHANSMGIGCRPTWDLLSTLPMYHDCEKDDLNVAQKISDTLVCLPSGVPL